MIRRRARAQRRRARKAQSSIPGQSRGVIARLYAFRSCACNGWRLLFPCGVRSVGAQASQDVRPSHIRFARFVFRQIS